MQVLADKQEAVGVNRVASALLGLAQTLAASGEAFPHVGEIPPLRDKLVFHGYFVALRGRLGGLGSFQGVCENVWSPNFGQDCGQEVHVVLRASLLVQVGNALAEQVGVIVGFHRLSFFGWVMGYELKHEAGDAKGGIPFDGNHVERAKRTNLHDAAFNATNGDGLTNVGSRLAGVAGVEGGNGDFHLMSCVFVYVWSYLTAESKFCPE